MSAADEEKRAARKRAREAVSRERAYIRACDGELTRRFLALPEYASARTVFLYFGTSDEPDTSQILEDALRSGKRVALPRTLRGGVMEARAVRDPAELVPGVFGIPEPAENAALLSPEEFDLVLVPALAYDREGYRLGHGGGYYDRYLARTGAVPVGLAWEKLLWERVPRDARDLPVSVLITEKKTARP